jgi:selenide,water dikinase
MAVVGEAHPDRLMRKGGARPGDLMILTKPLGTGILSTAFKGGKVGEAAMTAAVDSMRQLNRLASEAAVEVALVGATDVTGFGFLGHLLEMCGEGGVGAEVSMGALPFFDGVEAQALAQNVPGGTVANLASVRPSLVGAEQFAEHRLLMAADAQTSGGLLLAVPPGAAASFEAALERRGQRAFCVGVFSAASGCIDLRP